jgi:2,3-bisphosphoglycerate-independent phosphoglycerate mutase
MRRRAAAVTVVSSDGSSRPFLRGMVTHHLIRRGLDFDDAYAVADALRDRLKESGSVTTTELRELLQREVAELIGREAAQKISQLPAATGGLWVLYGGERRPFSRGILARSILGAGLGFEGAYRIATELHEKLLAEQADELPSSEIVRRVIQLLEKREGRATARRYRIVRQLPRLPRPTVVYVGGASGTGKSTLSLELAPLLRIYRINSTDTIRQVMRMVFSPAVLPAIHTSSFETAPPESRLSGQEAAAGLGVTFEEQAHRVLVGVRAVVERAIAENMSIVVEGVHLYPPLVPFPDLEGSAYQLPLVLGTLDEELHRSRFLARARFSGRRAERYLLHFRTIREIHDWILEQAEIHDVAMLDTSGPVPPVSRAIKTLTRVLHHKIPALADTDVSEQPRPGPVLLLVIDGLADRPLRSLGGRTPLQAAATPTLDRLAAEGRCGLADAVAPGVVPDTASGTLALLGQSPLALKRGPVEALGAGLRLSQGDIALRGNLATLDAAGNVIDRRAGRIREETAALAAALDRLSLPGELAGAVEVWVRAATEHRLAIVLRGPGLSSAVHGSDPGDGALGPPLAPAPEDPNDEHAVFTAHAIAIWEQAARKVLADHPVNADRAARDLPVANAVLTRGAGRIHRLAPLEEYGLPLRVVCIAGDRTILGLASWLGAETVTAPGMTANLDTDLAAKFTAARRALGRSDIVFLHLKGADIASHDQRPDLKVTFLENVDRHLAELLAEPDLAAGVRVVVASDHATFSDSGQHGSDPLPVLIWEPEGEADEVERFDEQSVASGDLKRFPLQMLIGRLFELR